MITVNELIVQARTWIGVPFVHQGRSRYGVDCIGFVMTLMREVGGLPQDFAYSKNYARRPTFELFDFISQHFERSAATAPGLMVLIRWPNDQYASHLAILTGPTIIHCYERMRGVVEHSYRGSWRRDTHSLWKLPGIRYP